MANVREFLQHIDEGCPHAHHVKQQNDMSDIEVIKLGHPLPCSIGLCQSKLRILRAASVHFPVLQTFLHNVYHAKKCHATVATIDSALEDANPKVLMEVLSIAEYEELIADEVNLSLDEDKDKFAGSAFSATGLPHLETQLEVAHESLIKEYKARLSCDPEYPCCSCERLLMKSNVTEFKFGHTKKFCSDTWDSLKRHMLKCDPDIADKTLYVCSYCRPILNNNKIPNRCILNGLITEPVPDELVKLNALERQLIQKAKVFQTVVRLGTYTGKVPIYNALKAVKGTLFFLPLTMDKTLSELDCLSTDHCSLPDPELYILVYGHPTKNKVVWQTLVDVNGIKKAVDKLKEINIFYKTVTNNVINSSTKKAIEAVSNTSSTLL